MKENIQTTIPHALQRESQTLQMLLAKADQLNQLNQILVSCLDTPLAKHCQVANLEKNALIVITHTATWATQFRFQAPDILSKLRQHPGLHGLKHITCKIVPEKKILSMHSEKSMARLSAETAETVLEMAETIQHDQLKSIMQRIARYTE